MNKKGQVTMEFMVSILALLIVFVFCLGVFAQRSESVKEFDQLLETKNLTYSISRTLNLVSLLDNNSMVCEHYFWIKSNQRVAFNENLLQVFYGDTYSDARVLSKRVNWGVSDLNGLICFTKKNDSVFVSYGVD